jgi:hypothetical protein
MQPRKTPPAKTQTDVFRAMTPGQRVAAAEQLYWTAREIKAAALRSFHPDWSEERIQQAVKEAFLYARG